MARRIPLVVTLLACAVMGAAIALVYTLVIAGLVSGGLNFPGQPEIADAEKDALPAVSMLLVA